MVNIALLVCGCLVLLVTLPVMVVAWVGGWDEQLEQCRHCNSVYPVSPMKKLKDQFIADR
jgi:hypothetical protein